MSYLDINPMDIDPETGRPYSNYSSASLDTSFHDGEMNVDYETAGDRAARDAGYTKRLYIDGGMEGGEFLTKPDTDLDGKFKAWGVDWQMWSMVIGCNVLIETVQ